jgi:MFS family permease
MDMSSEMIHGLLPVFLVSGLGASTVVVGLIEGVGEATASISKLFSGWFSDRLGQRKWLAVVGYSLGALSKPLFAMAPSASLVFAARVSDRIGKGIRGAPRDALLGDMLPLGRRGGAYGLRQALDTVGAIAGPLIAILLMAVFQEDYRLVFWVAAIPGLVSVLILIFGVRETPAKPAPALSSLPSRRDLRAIETPYWLVVAVGSILTLARFSPAFLILRAQQTGLALALAPLVLVAMNIIYALSAYPMGAISDRMDRRHMLGMGFAVLIAADLLLAFASHLVFVMAGVALWGLHMGMTEGVLAALVADAAPPALRATAFGIFQFAIGLALLFASLIAGLLWASIGPAATFLAGAGLTALGLAGTISLLKHR